ncbi:MAG: ABC transporter ATP-binding protein [Ilumatobacteraceae bacterium]
MSALTFNSTRKTFGEIVALEGLDLAVEPGELISLLGPSGCGKTTALRIAAGFERADAGTVSVNDLDITHTPAHKRNMGMVFQSYSLFPNLNVALNVDFGLRTRKIPSLQRKHRVAEMLELVQLSAFADRYPHQLSGGQQQRVALARALAVQPEVLLLDEPLSALDAKVRLSLRDEIRRIQTELGITTVLVTHDQEEALGISDRVGVMSHGRLEQLGTPIDVYRHPSSAFVARFVGSMNELPGVVADGGAVQVASSTVTVPDAHRHARGESIRLLVRPEDVRLSTDNGDAGAGGTGLAGTVVSRTFQGASSVVTTRLDVLDTLVSAHIAGTGAASADPGTRVHVVIDGTRAVCEAISDAD